LTIAGVDIGNKGAIALIREDGELLEVRDMPCLDDGPSNRPAVNAPLLTAIVSRAGASKAYVEWVGPRPTDGPAGAFAFGRARGVIEGVLAAHGVPTAFLQPQAWKRAVGIAPGKAGAKDAARAEAIRRWPAKAEWFALKKSDGRAEAALIALAGLMREARHVNDVPCRVEGR
jgi:crossover junction endodeoxyribonuclease RuvC